MLWKLPVPSRSRRLAWAARFPVGGAVAAFILTRFRHAQPKPRAVEADPLSARLAAEHGLALDEFLALDPDGLIDLFWPDPRGAGASHG
jgi:hypothetical protein